MDNNHRISSKVLVLFLLLLLVDIVVMYLVHPVQPVLSLEGCIAFVAQWFGVMALMLGEMFAIRGCIWFIRCLKGGKRKDDES